jgi:hypothetical protein
MNDEPDLRARFATQRQCDQDNAPAWQPELLHRPMQPHRRELRWFPAALATACAIAMAVFLVDAPKHETKLSEALPPLLDSPPGELFASLEPSFATFEAPSDFLLPDHLNTHNP